MKSCVKCGSAITAGDWRCPSCEFAPEFIGKWPTFADALVSAEAKEFGDDTFRRMQSFEERSFYSRARRKLIQWAIAKYFPNFSNFYDFGAGTGYVLEGVRAVRPRARLFGSDLSFDALAWVDARFRGDVTLFHADARHIPYADHFDVIGAFDVLEHIDDDREALDALYRAARSGGGVVITTPQHMSLWSALDEEAGHKRRYEGDELADKTRAVGFDVLLDTSFMATMFVPQYVSRRWLTRLAGRQSMEAENMLPAPLNGLFAAILGVELMLLRAGARFSFGGTRLVVARKAETAVEKAAAESSGDSGGDLG